MLDDLAGTAGKRDQSCDGLDLSTHLLCDGSCPSGLLRALERDGYLRMITTAAQLNEHVANLKSQPDKAPLGFHTDDGGGRSGTGTETIDEFYQHGLRAIGLTHYGTNRYGGGTRAKVGLSLDAIPLMKRIEALGMTLDLTHLSDVSFWQALDHFGGRVHASHQNSRRISDWQRQFSDEQYLAVIQRGGVSAWLAMSS